MDPADDSFRFLAYCLRFSNGERIFIVFSSEVSIASSQRKNHSVIRKHLLN